MKRVLLVLMLSSAALAGPGGQGVEGVVQLMKGDFMPGPQPPPGTVTPVSRKIYFHKPATAKQSQPAQTGFYRKILTPLVAQGKSGADGRFRVELPPGTYTMVVEESGALYANRFDGQGTIYPVVVKPGKFTHVEFHLDAQTTW